MNTPSSPTYEKKIPWYRSLWSTIWLTIFAAVALYSAGTFLYLHSVITPAIQEEREAMQKEREVYVRDFRNFMQEQTAQYHEELELWRAQTPMGTPPPAFNYQKRTEQFRDRREQFLSKDDDESQNPISPFAWLSFMVLLVVAATYPVAKRITRRLEKLQKGVETFGAGKLNTRVDIAGHDEVARVAQSFNESAEQIKHLIEEHKNLLSHVSHELRTPLARLRMSAELAAIKAPEVAQDLRTDIRELDELVEEILLASRLDAVPDLLDISSFDAFALAVEETARARAELEGHSIEIQADETLVRRALRNLLTNAEKYAPQGQVTLTVYMEEATNNTPEMVCFQVEDQGPGLSPEEEEKVFKPFFRGSQTRANTNGIGLGLPLVAQIAARHYGLITYKAKEGAQGCIFELRIPTHPPRNNIA